MGTLELATVGLAGSAVGVALGTPMVWPRQDRPLTIDSLLTRAETSFGHKRIITGGAEETVSTWAEVAPRARRLAHALDALGVPPGACVATFAWNSQRHVELYLAIPASGRVLHTVNHRLYREQITFIVNDAADDVVFVFDRILDPGTQTLAKGFFAGWLGSVVKTGPRGVELRLRFPFPDGLSRLTLAKIMPRHVYAKPGAWDDAIKGLAVGSGPYRQTAHHPKSNTTFASAER